MFSFIYLGLNRATLFGVLFDSLSRLLSSLLIRFLFGSRRAAPSSANLYAPTVPLECLFLTRTQAIARTPVTHHPRAQSQRPAGADFLARTD